MEFMRKSSAGSRRIGIGREHMILPGVEDPHNCMDAQNLGQTNWDQTLRKIECVFSLYHKTRWKWDDVYQLWGLPNIYRYSVHLGNPRISIQLPLLLEDVLGGPDRACLEMSLETEIERTQRCTWRLGSSEFGDALGDRDRVNSDLEAVIKRVWRCTWRPWSSEFGDELGGHDQARLDEYLEAVNLEAVVCEGGATGTENLFIG